MINNANWLENVALCDSSINSVCNSVKSISSDIVQNIPSNTNEYTNGRITCRNYVQLGNFDKILPDKWNELNVEKLMLLMLQLLYTYTYLQNLRPVFNAYMF